MFLYMHVRRALFRKKCHIEWNTKPLNETLTLKLQTSNIGLRSYIDLVAILFQLTVDTRMRFSNCCVCNGVLSSPFITLIKTFNFWLFVPVNDRLSSWVLSPRFIHSLGSCRAQVARWRLPRLVRPLRRVHTATLLSRVLTLGQSTSPTHTLGTYTTTYMWQEHYVDDEFFQLLLTFLFIKSIITTRSSHLTKSKHQMSHVALMSLHLPQFCWVTRSNICLSQCASDC